MKGKDQQYLSLLRLYIIRTVRIWRTFSRQRWTAIGNISARSAFIDRRKLTEQESSILRSCRHKKDMRPKADAESIYNPGNVVILLSHSSKVPSQYFCACGMWNISSWTWLLYTVMTVIQHYYFNSSSISVSNEPCSCQCCYMLTWLQQNLRQKRLK